jgi:8-oxo-dGTP pyrophosphatase MutT (NUDIX family)
VTEPTLSPAESDLCCPQCDYNLTGAPGDRCPWCGWEIDAASLIASVRPIPQGRRVSVALTGFIVGVGSFCALASLLVQSRRLSAWDALATLAVSIAATGHLGLGVLAVSSVRRWPMRRGTACDILRFTGWLAILTGIAGAIPVGQAIPTPRVVRGVQVNGALEFVVAAFLYTSPGWALLILRLVSFADPDGRRAERRTKPRLVAEPEPNRAPFVVDISERYTRAQLTQSWSDAPRPTSAEIEAAIARTWEVETALAQQTSRTLYNGELARLIRARTAPGSLHVELGRTCYRDFVGTNFHNYELTVRQLGHDGLANPLGISSTVVTRDGFLALGRRGRSVAFHAGYLHTFGGLLEAADRLADGEYDLFGAAIRELAEELHVQHGEISDIVITGLVRDRSLDQPELLFDVTLTLDRAMLLARFDPCAAEQEHTAVEFLHDEPETIVPFLRRTTPVAPVAMGALLLHGRHTWGRDWYEQSCYVLFGELPPSPGRENRPVADSP